MLCMRTHVDTSLPMDYYEGQLFPEAEHLVTEITAKNDDTGTRDLAWFGGVCGA